MPRWILNATPTGIFLVPGAYFELLNLKCCWERSGKTFPAHHEVEKEDDTEQSILTKNVSTGKKIKLHKHFCISNNGRNSLVGIDHFRRGGWKWVKTGRAFYFLHQGMGFVFLSHTTFVANDTHSQEAGDKKETLMFWCYLFLRTLRQSLILFISIVTIAMITFRLI